MLCLTSTNEPVSFDIYINAESFPSAVMKEGNDWRAALGCHQQTVIIAVREQAMNVALQNAAVKDIILIAGKGHEYYQEIGDQRFPFSDRVI